MDIMNWQNLYGKQKESVIAESHMETIDGYNEIEESMRETIDGYLSS